MRPEPKARKPALLQSGACCSKATQQCLARLCTGRWLLYGPRQIRGAARQQDCGGTRMHHFTRRAIAALGALALLTGAAAAQGKQKVSIAVGGAGCLCYLPTVLAKQLGEFDKAGLDIELINFKGGSDALKAVIGGSADVVSGYYDHCVNLAAKGQSVQSFVVYDRYPGMVLAVSPENKDIKSIKDLAGKAVGVSAPGSSTDFFLKYLLAKNSMDPTSASVVGIGLAATAVAAMEHGRVNAAVMLDPAATLLQSK